MGWSLRHIVPPDIFAYRLAAPYAGGPSHAVPKPLMTARRPIYFERSCVERSSPRLTPRARPYSLAADPRVVTSSIMDEKSAEKRSSMAHVAIGIRSERDRIYVRV